MPLLCVDIGNSHTVIGLLDAGDVLKHWRVSTDEHRTADEWYGLYRSLMRRETRETVTGVALCATVPSVLHEWRDLLERRMPNIPHVVVEPGVRTGVPVRMDNPREVGADRVVNALAAAFHFGGPAVVVDFGTATTFDVISPDGAYIGGAISPGLEISLEALGRRGAQLRKVEVLKPRSVIAKNTVEALQSGMVYGFAGQVDGLVRRMIDVLGVHPDEVRVISTGQATEAVLEECICFTDHEPWLTLLGLELVFQRNT